MDFRGYFATGDGQRWDPFTITDAYSRSLVRCQIVSRMDLSQVRAICEAAMREHGVPGYLLANQVERYAYPESVQFASSPSCGLQFANRSHRVSAHRSMRRKVACCQRNF